MVLAWIQQQLPEATDKVSTDLHGTTCVLLVGTPKITEGEQTHFIATFSHALPRRRFRRTDAEHQGKPAKKLSAYPH